MKKGIADSPKTHPYIWRYLLTKSWIEFKRKIRKSTIPKELEPLAEEARKYKSAKEFVNKFEEVWKKLQKREKLTKEEQRIANFIQRYKPIYTYGFLSLTDFYNQVIGKLKNNTKKSSLKGERIIWRTKYSF
jgi:dissimilatory sulfite reductase (desulfoviridin) alpha/beta subunit